MQKRLKDYDVVKWVDDFLEQLVKTKEVQQKQAIKLLTQPKVEKISQQYKQAQKRCILLPRFGILGRKIPLSAFW